LENGAQLAAHGIPDADRAVAPWSDHPLARDVERHPQHTFDAQGHDLPATVIIPHARIDRGEGCASQLRYLFQNSDFPAASGVPDARGAVGTLRQHPSAGTVEHGVVDPAAMPFQHGNLATVTGVPDTGGAVP